MILTGTKNIIIYILKDLDIAILRRFFREFVSKETAPTLSEGRGSALLEYWTHYWNTLCFTFVSGHRAMQCNLPRLRYSGITSAHPARRHCRFSPVNRRYSMINMIIWSDIISPCTPCRSVNPILPLSYHGCLWKNFI